jgi:hypothetical protein
MKFFKRKTSLLVAVGLVMLMLFVPFLRFTLHAADLGPTYLFPERLKAGEATDMILLITPSTDWSTGTSDREVRIYFAPGEVAETEWCLANVGLTSAAVSSAPVNLEDWTITTDLPGTLVATCVRGSGGSGQDYIRVTGVGELTADTGYGLEITGDAAKFKLGTAGSKIMTIQLMEAGGKIESTTFALEILSEDRITVTADVDPADSISCSVTPSSVSMGTLYKGGAYITAEQGLGLTTDAATGFYWAVYGTGNPSGGVNAGLWKSTETTYLLSSAGDTVNLLTGEGFGMVVTTGTGATVATNFQATTPGVFGGIGKGFDNAKLFLSNSEAPGSSVNSVVTLGARAGLSAEEGEYTETLTYVCGAYIGEVSE